MSQQFDQGRAVILGALTDFLSHLNNMEAPLVVGRDYKPDRLLDEFRAWCDERQVSLKEINRQAWIDACKQGVFKDESA